MAEQSAEQEPTMEEILASIRRIISEDDEPTEPERAEPPPAPHPEERDEPRLRRARETEEAMNVRAPTPPMDDDIAFEEPEILPARHAVAEEDDLVSEPVANAAAAAFGELVGQMLVSSRSTEGKTLEDIVRELIKPMLRQWLDANLRGIVEAAVAQEVARISARGRR